MKKNNLILLSFFILAACSKHQGPKLLISEWKKSYVDTKVVERKLANTPEDKCLKDIFSVDLVKAEIKNLEKNYPPSQMKGQWKHINLANIPAPQANFLNRYGDKLGDVTGKTLIDYSTCQDVPCIYNKIYGDDNFVGGYVHYLWYLKFGHMLSADNHLPSQDLSLAGTYGRRILDKDKNGFDSYRKDNDGSDALVKVNHALSKYLYSEKELYGLWRLSQMMSSSHSKLTNLNEIQRIPRGEYFEDRSTTSCGLANSGGHILLQDGCLTTDLDKDQGHLYAAVAHELSHIMDYKLDFISEQETYLNLSGFTSRVYEVSEEEWKKDNQKSKKKVLKTTGVGAEKKITVREWKRVENSKTVTWYAATEPMENFAETLAYYRTENKFKKKTMSPGKWIYAINESFGISSDHWNHVKDNYYGGQEFDRDSMMTSWLKKNALDLSKETLKMVVECTAPNATSVKSDFFNISDFSVKILPSLANCLGEKSQILARNLSAKLSASEPEACGYLRWENAAIWQTTAKKELAMFLSKLLNELEHDRNYIARINSFYDELNNTESARMAYLNCYEKSDEKNCYISEVNKLTLAKASLLRLPESHTQELVDTYQEFHPYLAIKQDSEKFYAEFVQTQRALISDEASSLFQTCLSLPVSDEESPRGRLFSMGEGYLVSSVYNCLAERIPDSIIDVVRGFEIDGKKVQHAKEEVILSQNIKPLMNSELAAIYEHNRFKERSSAKRIAPEIVESSKVLLMNDFSWVKELLNSKGIVADCEREILSKISSQPIYHLKKDLYKDLVSAVVCPEIESSPEYEKYLQDSKSLLVEKSQKEFEGRLLALAQVKAQSCVKKYPVDTSLNRVKFKKEREACLIDDWSKLEQEIINGFESDPLVKKFKLSPDFIKMKFDQNRRRNQLRIFKEYFLG